MQSSHRGQRVHHVMLQSLSEVAQEVPSLWVQEV